VLVGLHPAAELDLPQLIGQPPRQVAGSAGVNAPLARGQIHGRPHPDAGVGPRKGGEWTDAARAQELVGDHAPPALLARKAASTESGGSGQLSTPSSRSDAIVARICST
jgi:hypothetical protein